MDWILMSMFVVTASIIILNVFLLQLDNAGNRDVASRLDRVIIRLIYPLGYSAVILIAYLLFLMEA